jgi:hypothetical protein
MRADLNDLNIGTLDPLPGSDRIPPRLEHVEMGKMRIPPGVFTDEFRPAASVFSTTC